MGGGRERERERERENTKKEILHKNTAFVQQEIAKYKHGVKSFTPFRTNLCAFM